MKRMPCLCLFCFLSALPSCTPLPPSGEEEVSCWIEERIDSQTEWRQGQCQDPAVSAWIQSALSQELNPDRAIQIALLNNPQVQSLFEELGIAQANLVEAGLLTNPAYEVEIRYTGKRRLHTNIEYLITTSLLDAFLIPLRQSLAATEFAQTKLQVAHAILDLAFQVRETFYEAVYEARNLEWLREILEIVSIETEVVFQQSLAGNINALDLQITQTLLLETELDVTQAQASLISKKEKLNRLLGIAEEACLNLPDHLSEEIDGQTYEVTALEHLAEETRLDLQAACYELKRLSQMLGLKDWWTYTNLRGGIAGERDPDGLNLLGPGFGGEIPLFNYGQAERMRLTAEWRQARNHLDELWIRILSEVREAYALVVNARDRTLAYRDRLLPLQIQVLASAEALYNVMGLGIDQLLETKRKELDTKRRAMESQKEYLLARTQLDRALDGCLEAVNDGS